MKEQKKIKPLFDEWPDISFQEYENAEIGDTTTRVFYRSFFLALHVPEKLYKAFHYVLCESIN